MSGNATTDTFTYNAIGQITTTGYKYDGTGNLIATPTGTFTYNGAQQMTASVKDGVKTSYTYAGASMVKMLAQVTDGGQAYQYTYGKSGALTARSVAGTGTASVLSDPSGGQPLDLRATEGSTSMWVIDGIGNPAAAITDQGQKASVVSYSPYGEETVAYGATSPQWQQNPYGFKSGLRASGSGLTKFGFRWQSSVFGGWTQRDTLDAPLDPSNANRYAYAGSDPVNGSDPSGRAYFTATAQVCAVFWVMGGYVRAGGRNGWTYGLGAGPEGSLEADFMGNTGQPTTLGNTSWGSCSVADGLGVGGGSRKFVLNPPV